MEKSLQKSTHYVVKLLIAEKPDQKAADRAAQFGIAVEYLPRKQNGDINSLALAKLLSKYEIELIALAGFLKKIPKEIIDLYSGRILNIHPSLLPKFGGKGFYGIRVHEAALKAGETVSGCTVHLVNTIYDDGEILAQTPVDVHPNDTPESLQKRILEKEHLLYPNTINQLAQTLTPKN